jgi:hypothetical protein
MPRALWHKHATHHRRLLKVFVKLVNEAELRVDRSPQRHPLHVVVAALGMR